MNLKDVVAVSGMPGLYKMIASRDNGMIVEDFETGKRTFASVRQHQFTPLETVGIYTYKDVEELGTIFDTLRNGEFDIPDANSPGPALHAFFRKAVPDYDEERVYMGDIKKVVKWFAFLKEKNLFERLDQEGKAREESEKEEKAKKEEREKEEKRLKDEREKKDREERAKREETDKKLKEEREKARKKEKAKSDKTAETKPVKEVSAKGPVKETPKAVKQEEKGKAAEKSKAAKAIETTLRQAQGPKKEVKEKPIIAGAKKKDTSQQKAAPKKEMKPTSANTKSSSKARTPTVKKTASAGKKKK